MALMKARFAIVPVLIGLLCSTQAPASSESTERLRQVILSTRQLGAHGLGYNSESLKQLSQKLTTGEIPELVSLLADQDLRVGVEFALASQCEAALYPVRDAAVAHKMMFLDAEDTMRLVENFDGCTPEAHQRAAAMRSEIHSLEEAESRRLAQERQEKAANDARIQRNSLKLMDPKQAKELTRQEREEVFHRSGQGHGHQRGWSHDAGAERFGPAHVPDHGVGRVGKPSSKLTPFESTL